jgi:hypothetical protein
MSETKQRVSNEQAVRQSKADYITGKDLTATIKDYAKDLLDARNERDEARAMIREMREFMSSVQYDGVSDEVRSDQLVEKSRKYAE